MTASASGFARNLAVSVSFNCETHDPRDKHETRDAWCIGGVGCPRRMRTSTVEHLTIATTLRGVAAAIGFRPAPADWLVARVD
jgi:hypothetical protein